MKRIFKEQPGIVQLERGEFLEDMLRRNRVDKVIKNRVNNGSGTITYYYDKIKHPDSRVFESGILVLEGKSSIGNHALNESTEQYTVLFGAVSVNGKYRLLGDDSIFNPNEYHDCQNLCAGKSAVRFVKRKKF